MIIPSSSTGALKPTRRIWSAFVKVILDITIEAYYQLNQAQCAKNEWDEDTFTAALAPYIDEAARRRKSGLAVVPQVPTHTDEMRTGHEDSRRAKKPDIKVFHPYWGNYYSNYFAWEAKRIGEMGTKSSYRKLNRAYIHDGMRRFIDGDYSSDVSDGGMLGYVIYGSSAVIADEINSLMNGQGLTPSNYLQPHSPTGPFTGIYLSEHNRAGPNDKITLYHLMLTFNFAAPANPPIPLSP